MNKSLRSLLDRAAGWPAEAQAEAARALAAIEHRHVGGDIESFRRQIERALADPRPDVPAAEAFARIERLHAEDIETRGNVA
jgi:hypothetical protein